MRPVDLRSIVAALPASGLASLARQMLAALDDADAPLRETLAAYLELSGATNAVCARLAIHRNTLGYRIQRIEGLLGMDLRDGRTRATLLLALDLLDGDRRHAPAAG